MIGPAFGPTLGGYIVDNYSWPWIFYINLPVGALALFMVLALRARAGGHPRRERGDGRDSSEEHGLGRHRALGVGVATLQYVLEEGNRNDWFDSPLITGVRRRFRGRARRVRHPRAHRARARGRISRSFKDPVFTSGTLVGAVMFAMLLSIMFLLPVFMQELLGFTAMQSGIALMPRSLVMMVAMPIVGRVYNRSRRA